MRAFASACRRRRAARSLPRHVVRAVMSRWLPHDARRRGVPRRLRVAALLAQRRRRYARAARCLATVGAAAEGAVASHACRHAPECRPVASAKCGDSVEECSRRCAAALRAAAAPPAHARRRWGCGVVGGKGTVRVVADTAPGWPPPCLCVKRWCVGWGAWGMCMLFLLCHAAT